LPREVNTLCWPPPEGGYESLHPLLNADRGIKAVLCSLAAASIGASILMLGDTAKPNEIMVAYISSWFYPSLLSIAYSLQLSIDFLDTLDL
jgi:hypothetical protein